MTWFNNGELHFGVGIEDTFIPQEKPGHRKLDEYQLTQHYTHWKADIDLVADSGARFVRWGVPWYLVEPEPGRFDWRWVDQVAEHMHARGVHCVVDLMHYGTPLWLENSFLNAHYPERVASYGRAVAERYRGVWNTFTPLNEPIVNAEWCGQNGLWPPYLVGQDGFVRVLMALSRGMVRTQQEISDAQPDATFWHVDAGFRWEGETSPMPRSLLEERRFVSLDLIMGKVTTDSLIYPWLYENGVTPAELDWFAENAVTPDVVGVNYYPAFTTLRLVDGVATPIEAGVAGLRDLIQVYSARYHLPMAVTETSLVGSAEEKIAWLRASDREVRDLRDQGHPVLGYTWFPFFTLVDWLYRFDHQAPDKWFREFGLVDLIRGPDLQLERCRNAAFDVFRELATASAAGS